MFNSSFIHHVGLSCFVFMLWACSDEPAGESGQSEPTTTETEGSAEGSTEGSTGDSTGIVDSSGSSADDPFRPQSGTLVLDFTDPAHAQWFLENTRPFHTLDNDRADELVYYEWQEDVGICLSVSAGHPALLGSVIEQQFEQAENRWEQGEPIVPRPPLDDDAGCDSCTGITIPYFTPRRLSLTLSSINVADDNLEQLFPDDAAARGDLFPSDSFSRGFIGLLTRVPARQEADNVVADLSPDSGYEFVYIRPANGDTTPGPFYGGNPNTAVQFGARTFEWYVTRSQAFEMGVDARGEPIVMPVFEGAVPTSFGDTDFASLTTDLNELEVVFDSSDTQSVSVNGVAAVSSVTGEAFDRTFLGAYQPNNDPETMSVLYVEPGTYGCVQRIELEF
ncbi:MAG: hypothetical protein AAGF11_32705 [Myxococcota bacterium]